MVKTVYTIGHSNLELEVFIRLLQKYEIQILVDVRSQPYSSYVKHFNKENLKASLHKVGIEYFYGGNQLGGNPQDEKFWRDGKVDLELIRKSDEYKKGLQVVKKLISLKTVVIMCVEENPENCHRADLIAKDLMKIGLEVRHIRADGSFEIAQKIPLGHKNPDMKNLNKTDIL